MASTHSAQFSSHLFEPAYLARIVQGASGDAAAARLAGAQRGVVARRQLAAIGVSRGAIQTRRARG
ncbi:MAG TPA: hypothetical protein VM266_07735, partial [Solirubrobacteraceae bacterium]|nr:hypothetical protein [Solirubrobacteraceae bacterium]